MQKRQFRFFFVLAALTTLPQFAAAQFTTFIPPKNKVADSVKAAVAAAERAQADTAAAARITNMKVWVDSAAGVLPVPTTTADTVPMMMDTLTTTLRDGTRAPATASLLPVFVLAGLTSLALGAWLARPPARHRA